MLFVHLPVSGERPPEESDASSRDGQEVERGAMASSWSKNSDWLQLTSEEAEATELQRPETTAASLKVLVKKTLTGCRMKACKYVEHTGR